MCGVSQLSIRNNAAYTLLGEVKCLHTAARSLHICTLTLLSPALPGLSLWKLGSVELVTSGTRDPARYVQPSNGRCM